MRTKRVAVVIPLYHNDLSKDEIFSLNCCTRILCQHPIIVIQPDNLELGEIGKQYPSLNFEKFNPSFFNGRQGYNHLMLSQELYSRFIQYEYILIYQLDALVFGDYLIDWCDKGYDYIGAPWLMKKSHGWFLYQKIFFPFRNYIYQQQGKPCKLPLPNVVGNGGFSLRKTSSHLNITTTFSNQCSLYINKSRYSRYFEDKFWALEAPLLSKQFKIPNWKEALSFSFDKYPSLCYKKNHCQLPFGVHGFNKRKTKQFWKPILKNMREEFCL